VAVASGIEPAGRVDKFVERRRALAWDALHALGETGYARTSLREIALSSGSSHGVFHYYFKDKADLIACCVLLYKEHCISHYDEVTARTTSAEVIEGFVERLSASIVQDANLHRLWYDMRAQSLFEPAFRADVAEIDAKLQLLIWRIVSRSAELSGKPLALDPALLYALVDGIFARCLIDYTSGNAAAITTMQTQIRELIARF
jgi:AcrR family transcriptional regulator